LFSFYIFNRLFCMSRLHLTYAHKKKYRSFGYPLAAWVF